VKLNKKWLVVTVVVVFAFCLHWVKLFPDPYHEEGNVDFWTWLYRELQELLHGEREVPG